MRIDLNDAFTLDGAHQRLKFFALGLEAGFRLMALTTFAIGVVGYAALAPEATFSPAGLIHILAFPPLALTLGLVCFAAAASLPAPLLAPVYARLKRHHAARLAVVQDRIESATGHRPPEGVLRMLHAGHWAQDYILSTNFGARGIMGATYADGYLSIHTLQETVSG